MTEVGGVLKVQSRNVLLSFKQNIQWRLGSSSHNISELPCNNVQLVRLHDVSNNFQLI